MLLQSQLSDEEEGIFETLSLWWKHCAAMNISFIFRNAVNE
jgi:hypothetical protein